MDHVWGHTGINYTQNYIYIPQKISQPPINAFDRAFGLWFTAIPTLSRNSGFDVWPPDRWEGKTNTLRFPDEHLSHENEPIGAILYQVLGDRHAPATSDARTTISVAVIFGFGQPPLGPSFSSSDQGPRLWVCVMPNRWSSWGKLKEGFQEDLVILEREDPGAVLPRQVRYFSEWATRRFAGSLYPFLSHHFFPSLLWHLLMSHIVPTQDVSREKKYFEFKWNMQLRGNRLVMKVAMGLGKETDPVLNRYSTMVDPAITSRADSMALSGINRGNRFSRIGSY
jgi:hypothetical protein